jgi:hypothetical protein
MKSRKLMIWFSGIVVALVAVFALMVANGIIVFDHSAERGFENSVKWKGVTYMPVSGKYKEGKTIAKTKDGFQINEVEGDDSHTFLVIRSFLDQWLVVREDYVIPISGEITKASWGLHFIEDEEFLTAVEEIVEKATADFVYDNSENDIYQYKGDNVMRELLVAYEGCPVPTNYVAYMGLSDGRWCITIGDYRKEKIDCYYIPDEYIPILEKYFI